MESDLFFSKPRQERRILLHLILEIKYEYFYHFKENIIYNIDYYNKEALLLS